MSRCSCCGWSGVKTISTGGGTSRDLITITPELAGGSLITIELTTRPRHLTTTLTTIGLDRITATPPLLD